MNRVTMLCGPMGAGKTTHAQHLAAQTGALRFSIDEWMARLYLADLPPAPDFAWIGARVMRCHAQIWAVAEQVAARGLPVILDLGFGSRAERDAMRRRIAAAGHEAVLLYLTAPREMRQARIRQRNTERGDTYAFTVTDGMFAALDGRFEPPQPDETVLTMQDVAA